MDTSVLAINMLSEEQLDVLSAQIAQRRQELYSSNSTADPGSILNKDTLFANKPLGKLNLTLEKYKPPKDAYQFVMAYELATSRYTDEDLRCKQFLLLMDGDACNFRTPTTTNTTSWPTLRRLFLSTFDSDYTRHMRSQLKDIKFTSGNLALHFAKLQYLYDALHPEHSPDYEEDLLFYLSQSVPAEIEAAMMIHTQSLEDAKLSALRTWEFMQAERKRDSHSSQSPMPSPALPLNEPAVKAPSPLTVAV